MEELKAKAEAAESEVRAAKKLVAKILSDGNAARGDLAKHEAALEALHTQRSDLLEAAAMQQVRHSHLCTPVLTPCNRLAVKMGLNPDPRQ